MTRRTFPSSLTAFATTTICVITLELISTITMTTAVSGTTSSIHPMRTCLRMKSINRCLPNNVFYRITKSKETGIMYLISEYSYFIMSEIIINFLLCTTIYMSYVNLTIQLSQFDVTNITYTSRGSLKLFTGHR